MGLRVRARERLISALGYRLFYSLIDAKNQGFSEVAAPLERLRHRRSQVAIASGLCDRAVLLTDAVSPGEMEEITKRLAFYAPRLAEHEVLQVEPRLDFSEMLGTRPILLFGKAPKPGFLRAVRPGIFDVDYRHNHADGWEWCRFSEYCSCSRPDLVLAGNHFWELCSQLKSSGLQRAYVFGTGPSLHNALHRDWSDGFRIVCNTIVRDATLWNHLRPHFVVAGDAIYHFGHTAFARAFRQDLARRMGETDTFFAYPAMFHEIVIRELADFAMRLLPIPDGCRHFVHYDMCRRYELPGLGNVLQLLLLPLACTLSKHVCLWGFDGRAPGDSMFWGHSPQHFYTELVPELQAAHPAFFNHYVPAEAPMTYAQRVHGDRLEAVLAAAERDGWQFASLHRSWTPALQKRYKGDQ